MKAMEYMNTGEIDKAISRLESINDLNPNFAQTHYNLGIAYHKKKEYEKAISSLKKAIDLDSKLADAYYALGVIYEDLSINLEEEIKEKSKKSAEKASLEIYKNIKTSMDYYGKYTETAKNSTEIDTVKSKIEFLNNHLKKYELETKKSSGNNNNGF
jgi:tetratricopeptide (TPR) repeat protein